jgi:hypothetical protein
MSNRHSRRRFRYEGSNALQTYLCEPDDPALSGLLRNTANAWVRLLAIKTGHCIVCSSWMVERRDVGLVLLTTPATAKPTLASCCGICFECADLPLEALERAATVALNAVMPGHFEPMQKQP